MHNVGGNWTRIVDRPLLNTNEHVNFYAKVSAVSLGDLYHQTDNAHASLESFDQDENLSRKYHLPTLIPPSLIAQSQSLNWYRVVRLIAVPRRIGIGRRQVCQFSGELFCASGSTGRMGDLRQGIGHAAWGRRQWAWISR